MVQFYVLAFLFVVLLGFVLFQNKQYITIISQLVDTITKLKAFTIGMPLEKKVVPEIPIVPKFPDEDFGEGEFEEGETT
mgnify:CR=1 FL=1